jgi:hypothetical protein
VTIALLLGRAVRVGDGDLELLKKDWYPSVTMLIALEHTRKEQGCRRTCKQFGHEFSRLCVVDLAFCLLTIAQKLEAILDRLPLLRTQT